MAQFDNAIALAQRLIAKYGQRVVWQSVTETTPNPLEPWNKVAGDPVNHPVSICFVSPRDNEWRKLIALLKGTEITVSRLAGLMGAVTFTPKQNDFVNRAGTQLKVKEFDVLAPNGQIVLYTIEFEA